MNLVSWMVLPNYRIWRSRFGGSSFIFERRNGKMMDLINYKDTLDELDDRVKELFKEMDYRKIELTGRKDSEYELCPPI